MDKILSYLPPTDDGYLPLYLLVIGSVAVANAIQNFTTLHFTRRIYNGLFVPDPSKPADSVQRLRPAPKTAAGQGQGQDQVTPLAARLFGIYTSLAGIIRVYAAYDVSHPALYHLALISHLVAVAHFGSEILVFRTLALSWEHLFPLSAGVSGAVWMVLQYSHYVQ